MLELLRTLDWLFIQRNCLTFEHAFTKIMLDHLQTERTVVIGGVPYTIGGFAMRGALDQAISVMCTWVNVVAEVLRAEFPDWSVLHAFSVFDLPNRVELTALDVNHLYRVGQVFDVPKAALVADVKRTLPYALRIHQTMSRDRP